MSLLIRRYIINNNKKLYSNVLACFRYMHSHSPYNNNNNNNIDNIIDYTKASNCDDIKKHIDIKYDMIRADLDDLRDLQEWTLIGISPIYIYTILHCIGTLFGFK